jgi:hypothetical protein
MRRLDDIPLWLFALLTVVAFDGIALGGYIPISNPIARRGDHYAS